MNVSRRSLLKGVLAAGAAAALPREAQAREKRAPTPKAVGVLYDSTRCVGCNGCVVACKEANQLPWDAPKELSNTTKCVVKRQRLGASAEDGVAFVKQQCMHCVDPACVSACMLGALHKEGEGKRDMGGEHKGTGTVVYDKSLCVGCRYCQIACAFAIPKFEWHAAAPRIVKCEMCRHLAVPAAEGPQSVANPACCQTCPSEALVFGYREQLLEEARKRIAAEPERYQAHVYGETENGGTQVLYLAAKDVSFEQLGLPKLPEHSNAQFSESVSHAPYLHGLTPVALYATAAFLVRRNQSKQDAGAPTKGEK